MSESGQAGGSGAFRVAPQLTGKAQQAYAAMAAEDTGDYDQLKAAIFQRYSITETYRVRFRSVARAREESYMEMATQVMDLARKWLRKCTDADLVWEVFTVEQLLNSMAGLEGRRVQEAALRGSGRGSAQMQTWCGRYSRWSSCSTLWLAWKAGECRKQPGSPLRRSVGGLDSAIPAASLDT